MIINGFLGYEDTYSKTFDNFQGIDVFFSLKIYLKQVLPYCN